MVKEYPVILKPGVKFLFKNSRVSDPKQKRLNKVGTPNTQLF